MKSKLLIAETDDRLAEGLRQLLWHEGFLVVQVDNALQCLEELDLFQPDVLVLNLNLPWGGGDGVLDCLRQDPWQWSHLKVITIGPSAPSTGLHFHEASIMVARAFLETPSACELALAVQMLTRRLPLYEARPTNLPKAVARS